MTFPESKKIEARLPKYKNVFLRELVHALAQQLDNRRLSWFEVVTIFQDLMEELHYLSRSKSSWRIIKALAAFHHDANSSDVKYLLNALIRFKPKQEVPKQPQATEVLRNADDAAYACVA